MRKLILPSIIAALICGCAGYHVGSTLPPNVKTIYIPTVVNATKEPLLETRLTPAIQSEFMTRTSLKLSDKKTADAKLEVRVRDYQLVSIGFTSEDDRTSRSREYRIWMTADVVLRNNKNGAIIAESLGVRGKNTFIIDATDALGDLTQAKRSGLPEASQDLAREIADAVTETWVR